MIISKVVFRRMTVSSDNMWLLQIFTDSADSVKHFGATFTMCHGGRFAFLIQKRFLLSIFALATINAGKFGTLQNDNGPPFRWKCSTII